LRIKNSSADQFVSSIHRQLTARGAPVPGDRGRHLRPRWSVRAGRTTNARTGRLDIEVEPRQPPDDQGSRRGLHFEQRVLFDAGFGSDRGTVLRNRVFALLDGVGSSADLRQDRQARTVSNVILGLDRAPQGHASLA
jgi:hypothetical protein